VVYGDLSKRLVVDKLELKSRQQAPLIRPMVQVSHFDVSKEIEVEPKQLSGRELLKQFRVFRKKFFEERGAIDPDQFDIEDNDEPGIDAFVLLAFLSESHRKYHHTGSSPTSKLYKGETGRPVRPLILQIPD
jgi:hypothetical protein